jgi:glucokinase
MNPPITLGVDFGATSIKFGVVQDGRIIKHGNIVPTRQVGKIEPLIRSIVEEIFRLKQGYPALQAIGFGPVRLSLARRPIPRNLRRWRTPATHWQNNPGRTSA